MKKSNGVLSSLSSETSYLDLAVFNNIILKKKSSSLNLNLPIFSLISKKDNLNLNLFNNIRNNLVLFLGEISEKVTFLSFKSPILLKTYLSNFESRNTNFKNNAFNKFILGKLVLPKIFFLEEPFDFMTTLSNYKKIFWSPLVSDKSIQLNLKSLFSIENVFKNENILRYFVINSNDKQKKSSLVSFPIYLNKGYVYLTEIKSLSKENFFQEDIFLKKSPRLIKLVNFLRLSHNSFKH